MFFYVALGRPKIAKIDLGGPRVCPSISEGRERTAVRVVGPRAGDIMSNSIEWRKVARE